MCLAPHGFHLIRFEDLPFVEQLGLLATAEGDRGHLRSRARLSPGRPSGAALVE